MAARWLWPEGGSGFVFGRLRALRRLSGSRQQLGKLSRSHPTSMKNDASSGTWHGIEPMSA